MCYEFSWLFSGALVLFYFYFLELIWAGWSSGSEMYLWLDGVFSLVLYWRANRVWYQLEWERDRSLVGLYDINQPEYLADLDLRPS
jgi:hypothetical protein